jgi:hypothetical protein
VRWLILSSIIIAALVHPSAASATEGNCVGKVDGSFVCGTHDAGAVPGSQTLPSGRVKSIGINPVDLAPEPDPTFMTVCNNANAPSAITYDGSCTPLPTVPGAPAPSPQQQAQTWVTNFFQRLPMPKPQPQMSSPNGVTGGVHSLDLRIDDEVVYTANTPQGPLTLHAFAKTYVNWGDGGWQTYNSTGAPYPNSTLKHTWNDKGVYTIRVVVSWTAQWQIGNQFSGTVGGVATTADIPNWDVHQIRAVITSG